MSVYKDILPLLVYVDDILVVGEDESTTKLAKECISNLFRAKDQGEAHSILGMEKSRDTKRNIIQLREKALIAQSTHRSVA